MPSSRGSSTPCAGALSCGTRFSRVGTSPRRLSLKRFLSLNFRNPMEASSLRHFTRIFNTSGDGSSDDEKKPDNKGGKNDKDLRPPKPSSKWHSDLRALYKELS